MTQVVLGLGSNLGDRVQFLARAIELLESRGTISNLRRSAVVQTEALLPADSPAEWNRPFLNVAVAGETSRAPFELLAELKSFERELGRGERGRWAPREIDIDILAYGDERVEAPTLRVPHPGLLERSFALGPLAELVPGWRFPGPGPELGKTARELARARFPRVPRLMGIVNVTPDSFSDGGSAFSPVAAVALARKLAEDGADVIDLGAESTRPGATALGPDEEWARLAPVLRELQPLRARGVRLSLDTRHPETARRALAMGIDWLNDVGGFALPEMRRVAAESSVDLVAMHSLSVPADKNRVLSPEADPVAEVSEWAARRLGELEEAGVSRDRVVIDPGIGFGKTPTQSLTLLREAGRLTELGARVLVGHSRKSFLSLVTARPAAERDLETLVASLELARQGVDYLRVHNVELHARALAVASALAGKP